MFFSFEGIDGVGKSTQMELFCDWLRERGAEVVACRDPGSTPLGESLRDILLHSGPDRPIGPRAEMLLYMAARAQLVEEVIRPAQESGAVVVSDRYLLSNVVYQAYAGGLARDVVYAVGGVATEGLMPDMVFVLDMSPEAASDRRGREPDRMERRGLEFQEKLRAGYLEEARRTPDQVRLVNAAASVEAIRQQVRQAAQALLDG